MSDLIPSFIFGGENTAIKTPEDLARKRALVDALLTQESNSPTPRNLGEGLGAIGKALMVRQARQGLQTANADIQTKQDAYLPIVRAAMNQQSFAQPAAAIPQPAAQPAAIPAMPPPRPYDGQGPDMTRAGPIPAPINPNMPAALTTGQQVAVPPPQPAAQVPTGAASGQLAALMDAVNKPEFAFLQQNNPAYAKMITDQIQTIQGQNNPMAQAQLREANINIDKGTMDVNQAKNRQAGLDEVIKNLPPAQQSMVRANPEILSTIAASQYPGKPTWSVIGEDAFGNKQYGYPAPYDPAKAGTVQGTNVGSQPAYGTTPVQDLHGEEFLSTLKPEVASQVRAIVEGRAPYPTGMLANKPRGQMLATYAQQTDPTLNAYTAPARGAMLKDIGSGKLGTTNNALNTSIGHLMELSDAASGLDNNPSGVGSSALNYMRDAYQRFNQNPNFKTFDTVRNAVASEVVKAYRGAGGAEADIQGQLALISSANSPEELNAAIAETAKLLGSKIEANQNQYDSTMGPYGPKKQMIDDKSQKALDEITSRAAGKTKVLTFNPATGKIE